MTQRRVLGPIFKDSSLDEAPLVLRLSKKHQLPLQPILDALDTHSDDEVRAEFRIGQAELEAVQAYRGRFGSDTTAPTLTPPEAPALFVDENLSYRILPRLNTLFGWSTHAAAEQLTGRKADDETGIWHRAQTFNCAAILSSDGDFAKIAARRHKDAQTTRSHEPSLILLDKQYGPEQLVPLIETHQSDIQNFLAKARNCMQSAALSPSKGFVIQHAL